MLSQKSTFRFSVLQFEYLNNLDFKVDRVVFFYDNDLVDFRGQRRSSQLFSVRTRSITKSGQGLGSR